MRKLIVIFLTALFISNYPIIAQNSIIVPGFGTSNVSPGECDLDSSYSYGWINNQWVLLEKNYFSFDMQHNKIHSLKIRLVSNIWVYYSEEVYEYDLNNNTTFAQINSNGNGSSWENQEEINYTYNSNSKLLTEEKRHRDSGNWIYDYRYTFVYDANDNKLSYLNELWNNVWQNDKRETYTYDNNNNMLSQILENWYNNSWHTQYNIANEYDTNNNLIVSTSSAFRITYTYDSDNNLVLEFREDFQNLPADTSHIIYSYDSNNNLLDYLSQKLLNTLWINVNHSSYNYDINNNRIEMIDEQNWDGTEYTYRYRITYVYNEDNIEVSQTYQEWNGSEWTNDGGGLTTHTYDENNNITEFAIYEWNGTEWVISCGIGKYTYNEDGQLETWVNLNNQPYTTLDSTHYYYCEITGINSINPGENDFTLYPNPASTVLTIELQEGIKNVVLRIENLKGQLVYASTTLSMTSGIDVSGLANGLYLLSISSAENSTTMKVVVQH